jgi:glycine/D-amino acid oxidase-like deaminating enzyme/nitrite reductase/ring-hydroxylating ferredoxin subunit
MNRRSIWLDTAAPEVHPPLRSNLTVDVAVIGAGVTGLTAALLLKRAGLRVAVLEAMHAGAGATGFTTAHLTCALDTEYHVLERKFGEDGARAAAEAGTFGIDFIEKLVGDLGIECDFERVPGYRYTESAVDVERLDEEMQAATRLGLHVERMNEIPLPFPTRAALCFNDQAQLHPLRYLQGLAAAVHGEGSFIFDRTRVESVEDGEPCLVRAGGFEVHAAAVIEATHTPFGRVLSLQARLGPYTSYVIGCRLADAAPRGLYWDTASPYHYIREHQGLLLVGGADHKTGQESDTLGRFFALEQWTRRRFKVSSVEYRWSNEVFEPADGLPYIGRIPGNSHVYCATGYAGNGMTFASTAAVMLTDLITGRPNHLADVMSPSRVKPFASAGAVVGENLNAVWKWVSARLREGRGVRVEDVPAGEGRIVEVQGKLAAVYRDHERQLHVMSPACSHAGCIVQWNSAEKTWDCPCHGGRFDPVGRVLEGPPTDPLAVRPDAEEDYHLGSRYK